MDKIHAHRDAKSLPRQKYYGSYLYLQALLIYIDLGVKSKEIATPSQATPLQPTRKQRRIVETPASAAGNDNDNGIRFGGISDADEACHGHTLVPLLFTCIFTTFLLFLLYVLTKLRTHLYFLKCRASRNVDHVTGHHMINSVHD